MNDAGKSQSAALPSRPVISGRDETGLIRAREAEIRRFVRARYGIRETIALHRAALGWDILRAPLNVALSPLFLIIRLIASLLSLLGAKRAGAWLAARQIFLTSDVAQRIEADLLVFFRQLKEKGLGPAASQDTIRREISAYAELRNAVAEITTSLIVLVAGLVLFSRATPGVISLTGPLAEMRAYGSAVDNFWLGERMGRAWYWAFPVELSPWEVIATGIVLALIASLITTFAGLIADPVQWATGIHRRRLMRLINRLDDPASEKGGSGLQREHLLARMGDLSDAVLSALRSWKS
ncbi:DUF6635 family protein [Paracoccus aerodenitrificans]|uniref:DUF6635 family protein n=1 Tax=Paracoccus aerodenitrificans TaxID=3017781 RepID=UPI0022F0715B|nr:DUF6635 family protein [Paracoccus aerodenitrificans]WBU64124.1 hypothetical protein PAE61_01320 [Paracoccus aerodenitrificans]